MDEVERVSAALLGLDVSINAIGGGCGDGGCIIQRRKGMHTNGGCRCWRDGIKMQRYAYVMNHFVREVRAALQEEGS